jgi:hypothetical protein
VFARTLPSCYLIDKDNPCQILSIRFVLYLKKLEIQQTLGGVKQPSLASFNVEEGSKSEDLSSKIDVGALEKNIAAFINECIGGEVSG